MAIPPPSGVKLSMVALTPPSEAPVVMAVQRRWRRAEADLLAFHVGVARRAGRRPGRACGGSRRHRSPPPRRRRTAPSPRPGRGRPCAPGHGAEGEHAGEAHHVHRDLLDQVGEGVGVLERVGRVGVEDAAAVGAELLDDLLAGDGTDGIGCFAPSMVAASTWAARVWGTPRATSARAKTMESGSRT